MSNESCKRSIKKTPAFKITICTKCKMLDKKTHIEYNPSFSFDDTIHYRSFQLKDKSTNKSAITCLQNS